MEKFYIQKYQKQNPEKCYNLAHGGIGGNVWMYSSQNEKDDFVTKMTEINRHRCSTNSFKQNQKNNMIKRYSNEEERKKQSDRLTKVWDDDNLKRRQSEITKKIHEREKEFGIERNYKTTKCCLEHNDVCLEFESVSKLQDYITSKYGFCPSRKAFQNLLNTQKTI